MISGAGLKSSFSRRLSVKCLEGSNKDALIYSLLIRAGLFFHWWLMAVPAMDSQQLLERESRNQVISFWPNGKPTLLKVNQLPIGTGCNLLAKQSVLPSWYLVADHLLHLFFHGYNHLLAPAFPTVHSSLCICLEVRCLFSQ